MRRLRLEALWEIKTETVVGRGNGTSISTGMEMVPGAEKETVGDTSTEEGRVLVIRMENIDKSC